MPNHNVTNSSPAALGNTPAKTKSPGLARHVGYLTDPTLALYFSMVARELSLSRAAEILNVNVSTVSRKIDELEHSLGVRLFDRDTRSLRLAEAGEVYLHYVQNALHSLDMGQQALERYGSELRGRLRILSPAGIGRLAISEILIAFAAKYPQLHLALKLDPSALSLAKGDFDVAISMGMPSQAGAVVSRLGGLSKGFVATPGFLLQHGVPQNIFDLAALPLTEVTANGDPQEKMTLYSARGEYVFANVKLSTNASDVALQAILSGAFLGRISHSLCIDELQNGSLRRVMPEQDEVESLYSVVPTRKGNPQKVQLFVDFLRQYLAHYLKAQAVKTAFLPDH